MAVTYGFYNSLNKDRVYNAEQMSAIFDGVITDGVFASIGGKLIPTAGSGMQVIVKPGKCWFNSTWTVNDAELPLAISSADVSLPRIDAIVVEVNSAVNTRMNSIKVITGIPSANPIKPTLISNATQHQYALGYVTIPANSTSISGGNIENNVGKSTCPFVTSILQQTNIDDLFNQWEVQFQTWFQNVQSQLSGNVAANLQAQIDAIVQDGYGKNGVVSVITMDSSIQQLYSGLDALLTNMNADEEKRIRVNVTANGVWPYNGGTWDGYLRKHGTKGNPDWQSVTLYSYWNQAPVLFLTRDGDTNTWRIQEFVKKSELGGGFRIGDVRQGLPNMGAPNSDWHECDGTQFDQDTYPQLAQMCSDETTKMNMIAQTSLQKILDDLRPSFITDPKYWGTEIHYFPILEKYYGYTWCGNASLYGSNYELASQIDKCVIYDPKTLTYTVHNASYTSDMRTSYSNYDGMGTLFKTTTYGLTERLSYNPSDKCFYTDFSVGDYYDDDPTPTVAYLIFKARKSTDGYTWQSITTVNNSAIAAELMKLCDRGNLSNYKARFFTIGGKFLVTIQIPRTSYGSNTTADFIYLFKFDAFSSSYFGSFTLSSAFNQIQFPSYDNKYEAYVYPVRDAFKKTEEVFLKGGENTGGSSTKYNIRWLLRISPTFQCTFINAPFAGSYDVWIEPEKLASNQYQLRLKTNPTFDSNRNSYFIPAIASESQMIGSNCTILNLPTSSTQTYYEGPYYDQKMNIYFVINKGTVVWWYPSNVSAGGAHVDALLPSNVDALVTNPIVINGAARFLAKNGIYQRAFNKLICKKYPTISVSGLKTFVRQRIS